MRADKLRVQEAARAGGRLGALSYLAEIYKSERTTGAVCHAVILEENIETQWMHEYSVGAVEDILFRDVLAVYGGGEMEAISNYYYGLE